MSTSLKTTSVYLLVFRFVKIALSIFILTLSAKYFGVSVDMDIWIIVTAVISTINLSLWGPINETFRAKFVFMKEQEGEESALMKTGSLLVFIVVVTLAISLLLATFSKSLIPYLASSLEGAQKEIFVSILLLMIPSFVINELTSIGTSVLNAYNVFYMPEVMGIVSSVLNLFCIILLAPHIGIKSLIIAQYFSSFILVFFIFYFFKKNKIHIFKDGFTIEWKYIKPFIYFSLPFFFPYMIAQLNIILEKNLANSLGIGIVSIVNYASQFKGIIQSVFSSVLVTVMVPSLAKNFANKNVEDFKTILNDNIQIVFISLSFIVPFLFAAASPIANLLYNHGGIDAASIDAIVYLIRFYSFSIISVMLYLIFGLALLAQQLGKIYAIQGVVAQVITILLNVFFYKRIGPTIFPLSLLISHFLVSLFMFKSLIIENKKTIGIEVGKYIILILILSLSLFFMANIVDNYIEHSILQLTIDGILLIVLFFLFATILGFKVIQYLVFVKLKAITFFGNLKNR
jgi:putative peptidoglycan lipid II flippase